MNSIPYIIVDEFVYGLLPLPPTVHFISPGDLPLTPLCWKGSRRDEAYAISSFESNVTCQECLEWLHA